MFSKSLLFLSLVAAVSAADLSEPITLSSENGVLDILMIARPAPVSNLPGTPTGWVYDICKRPETGDTCPAPANPNLYGGTLLRLKKGDHLKVHLVNRLPPVADSKHASEPGHAFLALNPTNIHTHGLLVSPRNPTPDNPTYGDTVFVLTFNSANGKPEASPHMHSAVRYDSTDYDIKIPANHPSGLFWFHPHAHGVALNQVSAGLSGMITVGDISDYVCGDDGCGGGGPSNVNVRHMMLKDAQILPNGQLQDQEDPDFCADGQQHDRDGDCDGGNEGDGGSDYTNGKWFFTVNGQVYPTIRVKSGGGEIWRIANMSGSATYDLRLWNQQQKRDMLMQVISIDGVSVSAKSGTHNADFKKITGGKFEPETCPGLGPNQLLDERPVCTRRLLMMPSARAEIWVSYRDASGRVASAPNGASAVFYTAGRNTGPSGDSWPSVHLAGVEFSGQEGGATSPVQRLRVKGEAAQMLMPVALSDSMRAENNVVPHDDSCKALPPGHMRRIFYAVPTTNLNAFGLAYEEIDEHGNVVGDKVTDVTPFDPMKPTVCVPLGPNNTPVTERWQLVNLATEDHNFHIHQTRFRILSQDELSGGGIAPSGVVLDNVPLPHANGTCGNNPPDDNTFPIADWRAGLCQATPITVEIPFTIAGDFVYHCHILEHEDGGMMAVIRVRSGKQQ